MTRIASAFTSFSECDIFAFLIGEGDRRGAGLIPSAAAILKSS